MILREQIKQAVEVIEQIAKEKNVLDSLNADCGIILGTGLGRLVEEIQVSLVIEYEEIPHFPYSTVETHKGKLIFGKLAGKKVAVMQGRFHYYEGYSMTQITLGVRVMKALAINTLIISNACGGINPFYKRGDIMLIDDHINLIGANPLIGYNDDSLGPRFPDMSQPYSFELLSIAERVAIENKLKVHRGVYAGVAGPNLETRAEYRFLRIIGADVVGMSTVPEAIAANHAGMRVLGISIVTDECLPDNLSAINIPEIIEAANKAEPKMTTIVKGVLAEMK